MQSTELFCPCMLFRVVQPSQSGPHIVCLCVRGCVGGLWVVGRKLHWESLFLPDRSPIRLVFIVEREPVGRGLVGGRSRKPQCRQTGATKLHIQTLVHVRLRVHIASHGIIDWPKRVTQDDFLVVVAVRCGLPLMMVTC